MTRTCHWYFQQQRCSRRSRTRKIHVRGVVVVVWAWLVGFSNTNHSHVVPNPLGPIWQCHKATEDPILIIQTLENFYSSGILGCLLEFWIWVHFALYIGLWLVCVHCQDEAKARDEHPTMLIGLVVNSSQRLGPCVRRRVGAYRRHPKKRLCTWMIGKA